MPTSPSFGLVAAALNERARRVARAHGMLLLDVERMMRPLPLAKTLWDASHLHHNYSEPLGQLVLAARRCAAVALRPRSVEHKKVSAATSRSTHRAT